MKISEVTGSKAEHSVRKICQVLSISRSNFYQSKERSQRRLESEEPVVFAIKEIQKHRFKKKYGSKRMSVELAKSRIFIGRHKTRRVMNDHNLRPCKTKRFIATTDSAHDYHTPDNLLSRDFSLGKENQAWLGDITYLKTQSGRFAYLATILDVGTRKWLGYAVADHLKTELVTEALCMARIHQGASPNLVHHDRGVQYASEAYRKVLQRQGVTLSMSRKGNCWDNAPAESFFSRFKDEVGDTFVDMHDVKKSVFAFYNFYNNERLHSSLGYRSPNDYAKSLQAMGA